MGIGQNLWISVKVGGEFDDFTLYIETIVRLICKSGAVSNAQWGNNCKVVRESSA